MEWISAGLASESASSGNIPRLAAMLEGMPQTPDEQTRNAVTARITAHVTAGWPRLGQPVVRYRGQYCYVAARLPGYREPAAAKLR
jgi:hypothetical protein